MAKLRRLIDLPGVAELERAAVMKPLPGPGEARPEDTALDACSKELFGLTADEADAVTRPADWDGVEDKPAAVQVFAFEDAGWDVTDDRRRPLRVLAYFSGPLWLALRGVAGSVPFQAPIDEDDTDTWGGSLASEAERFRKR